MMENDGIIIARKKKSVVLRNKSKSNNLSTLSSSSLASSPIVTEENIQVIVENNHDIDFQSNPKTTFNPISIENAENNLSLDSPKSFTERSEDSTVANTASSPRRSSGLVIRKINKQNSLSPNSRLSTSSLPPITPTPTIELSSEPSINSKITTEKSESNPKLTISRGFVDFTAMMKGTHKKKPEETEKRTGFIYWSICAILCLLIVIGAGVGGSLAGNKSSEIPVLSSPYNPTLGQLFFYDVNVASLGTYNANTLTDIRCSFYNSILQMVVKNITTINSSITSNTAVNNIVAMVSSNIVYISSITFTDNSKLMFDSNDVINTGLCNINLNYTSSNGLVDSWDSLGVPFPIAIRNNYTNIPPYISCLFDSSVSTANVTGITIGILVVPSIWSGIGINSTNNTNTTTSLDLNLLANLLPPVVYSLDNPDSTLTDIFPLTPLPAIQASPTPSPTASITTSPTPTHWINGAPASESNTGTPTPSTTNTLSSTASGSATATGSGMASASVSSSASASESAFPSISATNSAEVSTSAIPSSSANPSTSASESAFPSISATGTTSSSASASGSASPTTSGNPSISATETAYATSSSTLTALPSKSASRSSLPSYSSNPTYTTSSSSTGSASESPTSTNTMTATATQTPTPSVTPSTLPNMGCTLCGASSVKSLDLNPSNGNIYFNDYYIRQVNQITSTNPKDPFITIPSPRSIPSYLAAHPTDSNIIYLNEEYYGIFYKYDISQKTFTTVINGGTFSNPSWFRADSSGNLYVADAAAGAIKKWTASNNAISNYVAGLPTNGMIGFSINPSATIMYYSLSNGGTNGLIYRFVSGVSTQVVSGVANLMSVAYDYTGGNIFYSGGDGSLRMYTISTAQITILIPAVSPAAATYTYAIITDATGNIIYYSDLTTNTINRYIRSPAQSKIVAGNGLQYPSSFAYNPMTGVFYIGDGYGLRYWDTVNYPTTYISSGLQQFTGMDIDPNNLSMLYICEYSNNKISIVNLTSKIIQKMNFGGYTAGCRFNPYDGNLYFANVNTGDIIRYNPVTNTSTQVGTVPSSTVRDITFDRYNNMYFIHYGGTFMTIMATNGTIIRNWANNNVPMMVYTHQVTSDGKTLYFFTTNTQTIRKYDLVTNTISTLTTPPLSTNVYKLQLVNDRLLYLLDYGRLDILVVPIV